MKLAGSVACALVLISVGTAGARHYSSSNHAFRQEDGRVRLDVVTTGDACTSIASVRNTAPPDGAMPLLDTPRIAQVTVQLARSKSAVCGSGLIVLRARNVLEIAKSVWRIDLYFVAPDGAVLSTAKVPVL